MSNGLLELTDRAMLKSAADGLVCSQCAGKLDFEAGMRRGDFSLVCQACAGRMGWLNTEEERAWELVYQERHALRGTRSTVLSNGGAHILAVLAPQRLVSGRALLAFAATKSGRTEVFWEAPFDYFVVGHALRAWFNFFPLADAGAILTSFRAVPQD